MSEQYLSTVESFKRETFDSKNEEKIIFDAGEGLTEEVIKEISRQKDEPQWMRKFRLDAYAKFQDLPIPKWGPDLSKLDLNKIRYFIRPDSVENARKWTDLPEDIRRTFEKLGIPEAERTALAGAGAQYECLSEDSLVFTNPKGPVKIRDIKIGDHVFALDEKTKEIKRAKVLGVKCSGIKKIFEVKAGTRTVKASDNHPFLTLVHLKKPGKRRGRYHTEWKYLKDLKKGDLIAATKDLPDFGREFIFTHPKINTIIRHKNQFGAEYNLNVTSSYNEVKLPEKSTEDLMWFLGLFLGDGYIKKERGREKSRVNIATPQKQEQLRAELMRVVKEVFDFEVNSLYKYYISINSTIISKFLEHIGFKGNAHTKDIPDWVFSLTKDQKLAFLGGYLDSDGYVKEQERQASFTSTNKTLLEKIRLLCFYCGLNTSSIIKFTSKHPVDKNRTIEAYRLQVSGNIVSIKSRYLFKSARLAKHGKKLNKFTSLKNTTFRKHCSEHLGFVPIDSIIKYGEQPTYDIEVEGHHNFVAEGFIVHNSAAVYHNLKKQWEDKGVIFTDCDLAIKEHPKLFKDHFMNTCVPVGLHKFTALHAAVWSGGSFIYVPEDVKVDMPLQAYFRMNAVKGGQFEHTLIIADKGSQIFYIEGCFTKGAKITTNPDYKPIEEVKVGDRVLTHTGEYKKVYHTQVRPYTGNLYNIQIFGDSTADIEVTEEHPFLFVKRQSKRDRNKDWNIEWTTPNKLNKLDYLVLPVNKVIKKSDSHEFEIIIRNKKVKRTVSLTKDLFRLVGYYLAEGSISGGYYLNFSFGAHEEKYVRDTELILERIFGVKTHRNVHKKNNGISVVANSAELCRIFKDFGTSCERKEIPQWMMIEDPEKQKELIVGLFRGDGNYYNKRTKKSNWLKEAFRINTTSEKMARQSREILLRFGIASFINKRIRAKPRIPIYTVGVTGEFLKHFGELVGRDVEVKINNKKRASMFFVDKDYLYFPIKRISKTSVQNIPVYNFSVEGDESYVAEGVAVHNCSAPIYNQNSLHAGCVELHVKEGARMRYSSVENWSKNTYNLNTKRAIVDKNGTVEWIGGNMGSGCTMLYPCSILRGENSRADHIGIAFAGKDQNQDVGAKVYHIGKNTTSIIKSKSISKDGGITSYRGLLQIAKGATGSKASVNCDALMMDNISKSNTYPYMKINESKVDIAHEATVGKISNEQIFYLMSRGISEEQAVQMIVSGFIEPIVKELPLEYAVELNRLIQLEMEGSIG